MKENACLSFDISTPPVEVPSFRDTEDPDECDWGDRIDSSVQESHHVSRLFSLPETVTHPRALLALERFVLFPWQSLTGIAYAVRTASTFGVFVKSISAATAIWRRNVHERKCENHKSTTLMHTPDRSARAEELEVVVKAKNGSSSAVRQLVDRYKGRIFRVAQKITSNREDAEEVVQNVFLKAFRNLANFRGDSRFYTWLVRIAINESLMKVRARRPQNISINDMSEDGDRTILCELADAGPNPEEQYSQEELRRILSMAVTGLGPRCRIVFQLRDIEGLTTEETAQSLKLSASAVKTRLRRARLHLRESLNVHFTPMTASNNLGTIEESYSAIA